MLLVDYTHMAHRASGIERITSELFSDEALAPLPVRQVVSSGSRPSMIFGQQFMLPALALANPSYVSLFPGYPPAFVHAALRERTVMYVHDLFLATRRGDLNAAGKYYLAPQFKQAIKRLKYFLTNSQTTAQELAAYVAADAQIRTYRPEVRNVFGISPQRAEPATRRPLIAGTVGTIEPRKNLLAAAAICEALAAELSQPVELHVIGRAGWGDDAKRLAEMRHVRLLGRLSDDEARAAIGRFDFYLTASHDEGLGLPLLETQYAGLAVVAPDKPVFREVLAASGTFVDTKNPRAAARILTQLLAEPNWRERHAELAVSNIARWNAAAARDARDTIDFLSARLRAASGHAATQR